MSLIKTKEKTFIEFAIEKVVRLWPVFAAYTALTVIFLSEGIQGCILDLTFLRHTGIAVVGSTILGKVRAIYLFDICYATDVLLCFGENIVENIVFLESHVVLMLIISISVCVLIWIITYYLVEKPAAMG